MKQLSILLLVLATVNSAQAMSPDAVFLKTGVFLASSNFILYILKFVFIILLLFSRPAALKNYNNKEVLLIHLPVKSVVRPEDKLAFKRYRFAVLGLWFSVIFGVLGKVALTSLEKNERAFKEFVHGGPVPEKSALTPL